MIKKNDYSVFIFGMCPLIPISVNFAYGLILAVLTWAVFFSGILAKLIVETIDIQRGKSLLINIFVISMTTFLSFLIEAIFPIIHGSIKIYIYILSFSYILFLSLKDYYQNVESIELPATYSIIILIMSAIREIFAFGSLSLPVTSGFFAIKLPYFYNFPPLRFFGTVAGGFILLGIGMWIYHSIQEKSIIKFRED